MSDLATAGDTPTDHRSNKHIPCKDAGHLLSSSYRRRGEASAARKASTSRRPPGEADAVKKVKPRPTHFLALPLGHHSQLREKLQKFRAALLTSDPPIRGLEPKIAVDPRRIHFTLGVMTLESAPETQPSAGPEGTADAPIEEAVSGTQSSPVLPPKTVQSALALLETLKPAISNILKDGLEDQDATKPPLSVSLTTLDVLKPDKRGGANVLCLGPPVDREKENIELQQLLMVCHLVHKAFKDAGYIVEKRPLKLHATLINTSHRKFWGKPFSYSDILASKALQQVASESELSHGELHDPAMTSAQKIVSTDPQPSEMNLKDVQKRNPPPVDFGTWSIDEIQLCIMGSHGPENEYISCGGIRLQDIDR
ncbi:hypothetical protein HGRIS_004577 [Hohenbuehelia grisea]|uniref:A-kinase anchor protein 7-like phosphoesterase domain-containing protein n=1 Tax=Hohenbuehelia grisea TaxID=104357 RepID=A0ABR3JCQ5_9AGAR